MRAMRVKTKSASTSRLRLQVRPELGVSLGLIIMAVVFSVLNPTFASYQNLAAIATIVAELGIITAGVAFLMIAGEFDLSVSSTYALVGFVFVILGNRVSSPLALLLGLLLAAAVGLINGLVTLSVPLPSFITTLGMMMLLRGVLLAITMGQSVAYTGDRLAPSLLSHLWGSGLRPSHFWFIAIALVLSFVLTRTRYGNWVFATGGNVQIAHTMGVRTNVVKVINFVICAVLAGLAGCIVISRFELANASFGSGIELQAIAAAVIGGTALRGGRGTIIGASLGAVLMGMVRSGLVMAGAPPYWYTAFVGMILILAATFNVKILRWSH
jgi:simple sugar transport system permease protein